MLCILTLSEITRIKRCSPRKNFLKNRSKNCRECAGVNVREIIADITQWLVARARLIDDTEALDLAIIERLREAGLPIARYTTGGQALHPQVDGFSAVWEEGKGIQFREHRHRSDEVEMGKLRHSPIFQVFEHGRGSRYRLTDPPQENEYTILTELRDSGFTDYVVLALPFGDGTNKSMTFATNAPGGFEDAQVEILRELAPALAATLEVRYLRHLAGVLMDTYVGSVAGRKVLEGAIKRGSGETIRAVIWFCDMKGFTALSERLSGEALLDMLNSYFEVMTMAIEAEKGEVLKFIGDAILAIFQPGEGGGDSGGKDEKEASVRALTAAQAAVRGLEVVNEERRKNRQPHIECGIALHLGELLYGNVGGQRRLDFTVIGPEVNLASRIEGLTRDLKRPVLVSARFAGIHGGAFENLGEFSFKGVAQKGAVFAPENGV